MLQLNNFHFANCIVDSMYFSETWYICLVIIIIISLFAITPLQVLAIQRKKEKEKEKKNSQGTHYKVQGHKTTCSVN